MEIRGGTLTSMQPYYHLLRKHSLAALAAWGMTIAVPSLFGQVGLGISPMRVEWPLAPSTQKSGVLAVSNDSTSRVRARAEVIDFFIDSSGIPQFGRSWPSETDYSCRSWLSLNPMETELAPGDQVQVRYTIRVPQNAPERSYHCAATFTTLPAASELPTTGLRMAVRVVTAFYVVVGRPPVEGAIKRMLLETDSDSNAGWRGSVVLENSGLMHFRATGEVTLLDAGGNVVESNAFLGIPVLPRREQRFLFPFKTALAPGQYRLRVRLDIGANEIQEATVAVEVPTNP